MCLRCINRAGLVGATARLHVLGLLALIEHPDTLSHEAALRVGHQIMMLIGPPDGRLRCDAVATDAARGEEL